MIDFIIVNSKEDTKYFSNLTDGFDETNANILINPSKSKVRKLLKETRNDLVLFGHGDELGLYNVAWNGYIVGRNELPLLRQRNVIGLWCFAGNFADRYELTGFFTSMFISNENEATQFGFKADEETIASECEIFSRNINKFLHDGIPYKNWPEILWEGCHKEIPFVGFNYEAMTYFDKNHK